ncbi:PhoX family phosphatase [Vallicoccus soli]|uniref:PhoX family phosphatase n=2 Tax=Vallicoccus soli TaxID=2339232 RepID=A0A3A3YWS6_9ACTN|nr:PhoX family phosphatase [Vallicoccus soli]
MTCFFRCGNACDHAVPNRSENPYFGDVVAEGMSRRGVLKAGAAAALALGFASTDPLASPAAAATGDARAARLAAKAPLTFPSVPPNTLDTVVVPNGYDWSPLMSWGDPVLPGAPTFGIDRQSAAAQAQQFGYNNDFTALLPLDGDDDRGLLVCNHEYTNEELMFRGWTGASTPEQARIAMAAHGMSVVEVERVGRTGEWRRTARGRRAHNRRIHVGTPFRLTGPAAGSELVRTTADPEGTTVLGTLNNCAGGVTPWGTVLSGEENFNQYFGVSEAVTDAEQVAALSRYGLPSAVTSTSRRFEEVDARFDISREPNEVNRFGWVVEVDPYEPDAAPVKHTALGRFKHEGANVRIAADGRAVAYMGDDERFDYLYKFVSRKTFRKGSSAAARRHNKTLLEDGDLYVAQLTGDSPAAEIDGTGTLPSDGAFDGTGRWLPLVLDGESMVPGFTVEEVLVHTRLAADALGRRADGTVDVRQAPTKMDRPEDVEPNPVNGKVYVALTNNTQRGTTGRPGVDEANPRTANRHGQVLELTERRGDAAADRFTWMLFVVAGDPADAGTWFGGFDKSQVSPISCPDNVAFDGAGNLWISTDGNALGANDGLFAVAVAGPERGHLKQFATVPVGAECCGPWITEDQRTVLIAVQHPGEIDGASVDNPLSTFPYGDMPRPTVCTIWRKAPGVKRVGA